MYFPAPVAQDCQAPAGLALLPGAKGAGEHNRQWLHLGRTFLVLLIIVAVNDGELLAVTQTPFVTEEVSASLPVLSDAVPAVSWSWLSGCRPGAEKGRH